MMQICNFVTGNQHANSKQTTFKQHQVSHLINKTHMNLSSLEYSHLIAWIAYFKQGVVLNSTQMQKLMFICYGRCLAEADTLIFADDTPKAWPFGPVFPRSYKHYIEAVPADLSQDEKTAFAENPTTLKIIAETVGNYCHLSATRLSEWSHRPESPWRKTVFNGAPAWNRPIDPNIIRSFFEGNWQTGL